MKEIKFSKEKKVERKFYVMQKIIYILTVVNILAMVVSVPITGHCAKGLSDGLIFVFEVLDFIFPSIGFVSAVYFNCSYCTYEDYKKDEVEKMIRKRNKREAKNIWLF